MEFIYKSSVSTLGCTCQNYLSFPPATMFQHTHSPRTGSNCPGFSLAMPPAKCKCEQPNCQALRGASEIKSRNYDWTWLKHCVTQWRTIQQNDTNMQNKLQPTMRTWLLATAKKSVLQRLSKALYASYCLAAPLRLSTPPSWGIRNTNQTVCLIWQIHTKRH